MISLSGASWTHRMVLIYASAFIALSRTPTEAARLRTGIVHCVVCPFTPRLPLVVSDPAAIARRVDILARDLVTASPALYCTPLHHVKLFSFHFNCSLFICMRTGQAGFMLLQIKTPKQIGIRKYLVIFVCREKKKVSLFISCHCQTQSC